MARVLISLGGLRSDAPCGEAPLGGPTWVSLCFNTHWADWHRTAVSIRGKVIESIKSGDGSPTVRADAVTWLKSWTDGGLTAKAIAIANPAATDGAKWPREPGAIWSKSKLTDLIDYAVRGAGLLGLLTGDELLVTDDGDERPGRSLTPLLVGVGIGVAAVVALAVVTR